MSSSSLKTGLVLLFVASVTSSSFALHHVTTRYRRSHRVRHHLRHVIWNPMFKGSHEMLVSENAKLNELELPRIANDQELLVMEQSEELVPLHDSKALHIADNLTVTRRYCRPWTRSFVEDFSQAFYDEFHKPIQINSAVRTMEQQKKLRRHNRNAGPIDGDTASTHMAGVTVDISKRGLTRQQHQWIEAYFLPLKNEGLIDPIEERRQPVFHVVVFDSYTDAHEDKQQVMNTETDAN